MTQLPAATSIKGLPGLVTRASQALAAATTAAEVLDARDAAGFAYDMAKSAARFAKAKGAHDELIAAAHRAQADALEIEAQAKRRLADEYDAAQGSDEAAKRGRPKNVSAGNIIPATVVDLGLTRGQVHEARRLRDAEAEAPGVIRRTLDARLERGEEPSKAAVRQAVAEVIDIDASPDPAPPEEPAAISVFNDSFDIEPITSSAKRASRKISKEKIDEYQRERIEQQEVARRFVEILVLSLDRATLREIEYLIPICDIMDIRDALKLAKTNMKCY